MHILYGSNNTLGSNEILSQFISYTNHEIKTLAYYNNHKYLNNIDWALDSFYYNNKKDRNKLIDLFGTKDIPSINFKNISLVVDELVEWGVDLVISDCEPISAHISKLLGYSELWYCSSLLLLYGLKITIPPPLKQFNKIKNSIKKLPKADKYLIYSIFCDIAGIELGNGFEWIRPYHNEAIKEPSDLIPDDCILIDGSTPSLARALYSGYGALIQSDPDYADTVINAELAKMYEIGDNLGKIKDNSIGRINSQIENFKFSLESIKIDKDIEFLHEKVQEYGRRKKIGA